MGIYLLFGRYLIENSRIENNDEGIYMNGGDLTVVHTTLSRNVRGIIQQAGRSTIVDTTVSAKRGDGPEDHGLLVFGVVGTSEMTIEHSVVRGNTNAGAIVASGGLLRMSNSVISNNGTGIWNPNATVETRGNNTISGNGIDVDPPDR